MTVKTLSDEQKRVCPICGRYLPPDAFLDPDYKACSQACVDKMKEAVEEYNKHQGDK